MVCVPPEGLYGPEVCDLFSIDEDCSGFSNENDSGLILQGEEWEYWGPEETLNVR